MSNFSYFLNGKKDSNGKTKERSTLSVFERLASRIGPDSSHPGCHVWIHLHWAVHTIVPSKERLVELFFLARNVLDVFISHSKDSFLKYKNINVSFINEFYCYMKNILSSFLGSLICYGYFFFFIPVFVRLILVLYNHQRDVRSVFTVSIFRPGLLILHLF